MEKIKVSLNRDCPCRSGEKYKNCCMGTISEEQEEYFGFLQYFDKIKDKLIAWFWVELEEHEREYYTKEFGAESVEEIRKQENPAEFFEWLFYQAKDMETKENILKVIIERYPYIFNPDELLILRERTKNSQAGVFEIVSSDENTWKIMLKELNTGGVYEVMDRLGSLDSATGDILLTRIEKVFSKYYLCGFGMRIPRRSSEKLLSFIKGRYENKKKELPKLEYKDFMNSNLKEIMAFKPEPVKFIANDGEELKICEGKFTFNKKEAIKLLDYFDKSQDFLILEVNRTLTGYSANIVLKRIKSKVEIEKEGQMISSFVISPSGEKIEYSGSIDIKGSRIKIFSQSEKTYRSLIDVVNKELNKKLVVVKETIESPEEVIDDKEVERKGEVGKKRKTRYENEVGEQFLMGYYKEWCDEKIPALNNLAPREAVKTQEGKKLLKDLLMDFKNIEERQRKSGKIGADFSAEKFVRDELKFYE